MFHIKKIRLLVRYRASLFLCGLIIFFNACVESPTLTTSPENTLKETLVSSTTPILTEKIGFYWLNTKNGDEKIYPNTWENVNPNKIQQHTFSFPIQTTTGKDGSNWYIGPFGIVWKKTNGDHILFSDNSPNTYDFPNGSDFRWITVAPDGQVWAGGRNKTLFRFDGKEWFNEGKKLPDAPGNPSWLCYNKNIVGIDFDKDEITWILTAEIEIYYLVGSEWSIFSNRIPDDFMPIAGGGACPLGIKVDSSDNIVIRRGGCCERPDIGIYFDGKAWKKIDEPKDIEMMFQWADTLPLTKRVDNQLHVILALHDENNKPIEVVPLYSWLAPPYSTYVAETKNSIIYITNENVSENEFFLAKFDKKTKSYQSFLLKNFNNENLCAANVDKDGYIWLQFGCFARDSNGDLLPVQNTLFRFSQDIFEDYRPSQNTP